MGTLLKTNTPSTVADGTTAVGGSGGNTGGASGDYFDRISGSGGATITFATRSGVKCYDVNDTVSGQRNLEWVLSADQSDYMGLAEFEVVDQNPDASLVFAKGFSDVAWTTAAWSIFQKTDGTIGLTHATGTVTGGVAVTLAPGIYTCRYRIVAGSSAEVRIYNAAGTELGGQVFANSGFGVTRSVRHGIGTSTANVGHLYFRKLQAWAGPLPLPGLTLGISVSLAVDDSTIYTTDTATLTPTRAGGTGSGTVTWVYTKTSGPTATFSTPNSTTGVSTFTPTGGAGTYVLRVTGTDTSGSDFAEVTVIVSAAPTNVSYASITSSAGWNATGGTAQAVLADNSDATYLETTDTPTGVAVDGTLGGLTAPASGQPFTVRLRGSRQGGTTASVVAKLYEGATLRSTVTVPSSSIPATTDGAFDVTFPAVDLTSIAGGSWSSGLRLRLEGTAS